MPYRCYTREHLLVDLCQVVVTQRQKGTFGDVGENVGLDGGNVVFLEVNPVDCGRYIRWNLSQSTLGPVVRSIADGFIATFIMSVTCQHHY